MRYLLDTHAFIWLVDAKQTFSLSQTAKRVVASPSNEILVSIVSLWEIAIKVSIGKLILTKPFDEFIETERKFAKIKMLPFSLKHTKTYANLPYVVGTNQKPHQDPFDRMLASIAKTENIPIISKDPNLPLYTNLQVIW